MDSEKNIVTDYLERTGYSSIDDWAADSDMKQRGGIWYDSNNNEVNPAEYLELLIRELGL